MREMKDSRIEWIGQIPSTWRINKGKYFISLLNKPARETDEINFIRDGQDLRFSNFAQVPLYEPPLSEQEDIASYLDMKCSQIDSISDQKKEQLTVLEAYKKSLIYEYVTGKKEVPVQ